MEEAGKTLPRGPRRELSPAPAWISDSGPQSWGRKHSCGFICLGSWSLRETCPNPPTCRVPVLASGRLLSVSTKYDHEAAAEPPGKKTSGSRWRFFCLKCGCLGDGRHRPAPARVCPAEHFTASREEVLTEQDDSGDGSHLLEPEPQTSFWGGMGVSNFSPTDAGIRHSVP